MSFVSASANEIAFVNARRWSDTPTGQTKTNGSDVESSLPSETARPCMVVCAFVCTTYQPSKVLTRLLLASTMSGGIGGSTRLSPSFIIWTLITSFE